MKTFSLLVILLLCSCTKKLEQSSQQMAATSSALQESTKHQMDQLLIYIQQLNITMKSLDQNFALLLNIMNLMNMNLEELAKLSPILQKFITDAQATLKEVFKTSKTQDLETENIEDFFKE